MINEIRLKNFKCFDTEVIVPVKLINLLTGINGRGKSTTLQSLLLMRQSPEHSRTTNQIIFNGSCVELGTFDDIRNSNLSRTDSIELSFSFTLDHGTANLRYILLEDPEDDLVALIDKVTISGNINERPFFIEMFPSKLPPYMNFDHTEDRPLFWRNLLYERMEEEPFISITKSVNFANTHYISADRIGPKDFYIKQSFTEFPNVGKNGENTANILSKIGDEIVDPKLCLTASQTNTVLDQAAAWLSKIFDGGEIRVKPTDANIVILSLNSEKSSKTYKPTNVGFGYSYVLPIIVSGLIAKSGETIIVENPEAHLHPYAQSQLSRFLSLVSSMGIQLFIESHSDHILNGLRIAVVDGVIRNDDLNILYFDRGRKERIERISVDARGAIEHWPEGFFDQTNVDFSRLFGV